MNPNLPHHATATPAFASVSNSILRHTVVDGDATSLFLREGSVAAQVLLTAGVKPRLLVAFAAGNSGATVWFHPTERPVTWQQVGEVNAITAHDAQWRVLHGVEFTVQADAAALSVRLGLMGSVRVLRDHQFDGRLPPVGVTAPELTGQHTGHIACDTLTWQRDRADGAAGYAMTLHVQGGAVLAAENGFMLQAESGQTTLRLTLRVLTGDTPLQPLEAHELFNGCEADLPSARASLLFLSYRENLFAGSWRFHTYFGRDTLMALRLLMPVLKPTAIEDILGSVLVRLNAVGEVAHEEDLGEFTVLHRLKHHETLSSVPILDYKMVDDDFMLLPVVAAYLQELPAGKARAQAFLAQQQTQPSGTRETNGALLTRNIACVLRKAKAFAAQPQLNALVRLKPSEIVGDWRDSGDGLGGGVYAYSVNAVLVPSALRAAQMLLASGLFAPYVGAEPSVSATFAASLAGAWEEHAPAFFDVPQTTLAAQRCVADYAASLGVPDPSNWAQDVGDRMVFSALSLDDNGTPIPVMHSDFSFALMFAKPSPARLAQELHTLMRPFPAGLMTDVGLLVANAAFATPAVQPLFGRDRYHGAVVWSWQQAMVAAGLARQLERDDLPNTTRAALHCAQTTVWKAILATRDVADGELWSWAFEANRYRVQSFGPLCVTADESNAAQLWSTVYLAVTPPAGMSL